MLYEIGKTLTIVGRSGGYYLVAGGLHTGDKIVYAGLDRLRDGAKILPQALSMDSLIKARPL